MMKMMMIMMMMMVIVVVVAVHNRESFDLRLQTKFQLFYLLLLLVNVVLELVS